MSRERFVLRVFAEVEKGYVVTGFFAEIQDLYIQFELSFNPSIFQFAQVWIDDSQVAQRGIQLFFFLPGSSD